MSQFLAEELRNFSGKGWLGILGTGNRDTAPDNLTWYEELTTNDLIVKPSQVWGDFASIPPAPDLATAQANAVASPTIIEDLSQAGSQIHMTPSPNQKTFFATTTYNDLSTRIGNFIMPQIIPRTDVPFVGFPSIGYMVRVFNGDPFGGGVEILTSQDQVGGVVGWFFNFGVGGMTISSSFSGIVDPTDVWLLGFRYIGSAGGGGGTLEVKDEGATISTNIQKFNFIGIDVSAYVNGGDATQADIYIPALVFQPFFDQSNAQGDASVADTATSSRNVSDPAPENNFAIGGWAAGSAQDCTRTSPLSWTHAGSTCSFEDNTTTTVEVNVFDEGNDGTGTGGGGAVLETYTTPAIVGNAVNSGVNIDVTITNWAVDSIKFQGTITVDVDIDTLLANGGRFTIEIIHHNAGTDYTYVQGPLFLDDESAVAAITGVTIAETGGSVVTTFLSGIEYYDTGSEFTIAIADIDNLNNDSYPATQVQVAGGEYGLPTLSLAGSDLTGWTNYWNDVDDTYSKTDWAINQANYFYVGTTANASGQVFDWVPGATANSPNASIAIETHNSSNTRLLEDFYDESWRCPSTANFDAAAARTWTSSNDVGAGDAIFYNGGCERIGTLANGGDMTVFAPNAGTQPDYSASQNATVYLWREFQHDGTSSSSMRINITGSYTSLEYKLADLWVDDDPSRGTVWVDALLPYNAGNWNEGNPTGGTGGQTGSGAGYIDVSFGVNNISNTGDTVYLRIGLSGADRITALSVTFT